MAKKSIVTFLSPIKREGESGSVRGKVPAGLIKMIGAKDGDCVQFEVHGSTLVGAQVLSGKVARLAMKEKEAEAKERAAENRPAPKAKKATAEPKKATKKTTAPAPVSKNGKKVKPVVKGNKRRTEVEYEAPPVKKGKPKFVLGKKKKK